MKWMALILALLTAGYLADKIIDRHAAREALPRQQREQLEAKEHNDYAGQGITVYHDTARHVTCWKYREYNRGGISCLPDSQVTLTD